MYIFVIFIDRNEILLHIEAMTNKKRPTKKEEFSKRAYEAHLARARNYQSRPEYIAKSKEKWGVVRLSRDVIDYINKNKGDLTPSQFLKKEFGV